MPLVDARKGLNLSKKTEQVVDSSLLEREKKNIERMKNKQEQEIKKMID
jgi:hypothetical protein